MIPREAFFTVHRDLPREGPGSPEDVHWALDQAGVPDDARLLDAACGPGADTVTLAEACPTAKILAVDKHAPFVEAARGATARFGPRVVAECQSYLEVDGPFDFIWCAGAAYFAGYLTALEAWRPMLVPGASIAFSEPAWMTEPPSDAARAFWDGEGDVQGLDELTEALGRAGWSLESHRWIVGEPWRAYYDPMRARLATLKSGLRSPDLDLAIAEHETEIAQWDAARDEIAYVLLVVRPA